MIRSCCAFYDHFHCNTLCMFYSKSLIHTMKKIFCVLHPTRPHRNKFLIMFLFLFLLFKQVPTVQTWHGWLRDMDPSALTHPWRGINSSRVCQDVLPVEINEQIHRSIFSKERRCGYNMTLHARAVHGNGETPNMPYTVLVKSSFFEHYDIPPPPLCG